MRRSNRYLSGKTMTVAAFAVQDWGLPEKKPTKCFDCGDPLPEKPRICPIMGEYLCEFCYNYRLEEREKQRIQDEIDLLRGMGVEPPKAVLNQIEEDYWE